MMDGSVMVVFVQKWMKKMRDGDVFLQKMIEGMKKKYVGVLHVERCITGD